MSRVEGQPSPGEGGASSIRVMGADGGGTRLRLALADGEGRILARRNGPPALVLPGQAGGVAASLAAEVRVLAREAGVELPLDALCVGLAGVGRPGAAARVRGHLEVRGLAREVRVVTDARVALDDAFPEEAGVLLVAGTGSIALARRWDGEVLRVGGWGALLGDEGSGYRLALEGLRAAIRGSEGRGPTTELTGQLLEALGAEGGEGVLGWIQHAEKGEVSALATIVARTAEDGDEVAGDLLQGAVDALLAHARALLGALATAPDAGAGHPPPRVALTGGLLEEGGCLRERLLEALGRRGIPALDRPVDAAQGAVLGALRASRSLWQDDPS